VCEDQVERPRHLGEIERIDEETRVADLPPPAAAHEAPKLLFGGPSLPRGLLLEGAEGSQLALSADDLFDGGGAESADQLVLQVCVAGVETQLLHLDAREAGAEAGPLETAPEVVLFSGVIEARQPDVEPLRAEVTQEPSDGLRTPNRHNGDALSAEVPPTTLGKRFERALVADPLDEHDRARVDACGARMYLLLVHNQIFTVPCDD